MSEARRLSAQYAVRARLCKLLVAVRELREAAGQALYPTVDRRGTGRILDKAVGKTFCLN